MEEGEESNKGTVYLLVFHRKDLGVLKKGRGWDFPGGPVVKNLYFHCREQGFNPWSGN